jgi:hypothetical protein
MIPYEELDRALARWKARSQGGVPDSVRPVGTAAVTEVEEEVMDATPLPIPAEELGSIPNGASPSPGHTGEIDADDLESYEDKN